MMTGTYVGPARFLRNRDALVRPDPVYSGRVLAQFNNLSLPKNLTHGWISFPSRDWHFHSPLLGEET